ncbi:MAG: hypothetical protein MUO63_17450 [Desulfobulbaceae bacterium]|nr:hypothetical protein [Desulfobulbaceae bacterium]
MFRKIGVCGSIILLLISLECAAENEKTQGDSTKSITPIFSQLLLFPFPSGFKTVFENTRDTNYIREAVLHGETEKQWTQMLTVTGAKGLSSNPNVTPGKYANSIASGFKKACPNSYGTYTLQQGKVNGGYDEFAAVVGCGTSPTTGGQTSESALIIVIKGEADYYTIQWAERGSPSNSPIPIDTQKWKERLSKLLPIKICPIVPGEKAPYPSCIDAKRP